MALACCQQHGISAAEAYLLERQGDIPAALAIFISEINKANRLLTAAVKSGRITLPRTAPRSAPCCSWRICQQCQEPVHLPCLRCITPCLKLIRSSGVCKRCSGLKTARQNADRMCCRLGNCKDVPGACSRDGLEFCPTSDGSHLLFDCSCCANIVDSTLMLGLEAALMHACQLCSA